MKTLMLEDLKDMTDAELRQHIEANYKTTLPKDIKFLIAYESVGAWGCDSASSFLFRLGGKLYEVHGSHCSCYGFENQWEPEEVTINALQYRIANDGQFLSLGGYDSSRHNDDATSNLSQAHKFIMELKK